MNLTNTYALTEKAMKALNKIRENSKKDKEKNKVLNEMKIPLLTTNKQVINDEYDEKLLIKKNLLDSNVYDKMLCKLNESEYNIAVKILENIRDNVKEVYQLSNIKPRIYGFTELSIDSSKEDLISESSRIIKEHFNKGYYQLTTKEREKRYKDQVVNLAHSLITENKNDSINTKNALDFAYKTVMVKNLLKKINFPYLAESKINELLESDLYKEFFDSERLHILMQEFDGKIDDLSKIIAISI